MIIASSLRIASLATLTVVAFAVAVPSQARTHGSRFQRHGQQVGHVGGTYRNGQGGVVHVRDTRVSGPNGTAVHGAYTSVNPDGSVKHQGVSKVSGANGGSIDGSNSYARNTDGNWDASHQVSASGTRGSYDSNAAASNGSAIRDRTITNASGDSYQGQTSWTKGQGVSHSGSCTDAGGNTIPCGH